VSGGLLSAALIGCFIPSTSTGNDVRVSVMADYDTIIIGGGIVGLATAWALVESGRRKLLLLEGESRLAAHQTGHNSGVIHSGLYYAPGSFKARFCVEGRAALYRFCAEHGVAHERCGKLVVAVNAAQQPALRELERRGQANGLGVQRVSPEAMREREPEVAGVEGLLVPDTGIVDFVGVCDALARLIQAKDGQVRLNARVQAIRSGPAEFVVRTGESELRTRHLINCAGLYSDHIARLAGLRPDVRIVPFRGEYVKIKEQAQGLVRHLIYPVPDPRFPFLGVHFTRMIQGGVEAGPNALLTFRRRWYGPGDPAEREWGVLRYGGFWRMLARYGRVGMQEMWRSRSRTAFVRGLQALVPALKQEDVEPHGSGVRAQAVNRQGRLVDDFHVLEAARQIHVLNAPSPAATAALRIGQYIAAQANNRFR
jgi:(S)-2-hydroxyglutarate dehydrogenase